VMLVGQPSEEIGQGAEAMIRDGLYERFPRPDFAIALHDWPLVETGKVGYRAGYVMANIDAVDLTVRGVGGHGAAPEKSKDPIVLAAEIVMALQTIVSRETSPLDSVVVTVGSFHGGTKRNIIPDEVKLLLTVRSYKPDVRKRVLASIERITKGIALAAGIPEDRAPVIDMLTKESGDAVFNDPDLTARLAKALGGELGGNRIVEVDPAMVSEDFVHYGLDRKIPIAMLFLGAGDPQRIAAGDMPGLHSSKFAPSPELILRTGVEALTTMTMELLRPR
jgi:amidohydrolase